jgi:hypothetical protein
VDAEVNWEEYFQKIRRVCPWSWAEYRKGRIDIVAGNETQPLGNFAARIYIVDIRDHNELEEYHDYLNETTEDEWLYSHPYYGGNSTEIPVLIQQDAKLLENARNSSVSMQKA